jgi:hypothetical protein
MTDSPDDLLPEPEPFWADSHNIVNVFVPHGPADLTRRPISAARRQQLEKQGLISPVSAPGTPAGGNSENASQAGEPTNP